MRHSTLALGFFLSIVLGVLNADAAAGALREHTVYRGQTLGMIAKRYNVSIDAICTANGIRQRDPIKPGQKLTIPSKDDKAGEAARRARKAEKTATSSPPRSSRERPQAEARTHTVYAGHTLGKIAKRYNVSIESLCHANGITRSEAIRPGQRLVIPAPDDQDGSRARLLVRNGYLDRAERERERKASVSDEWKKYAKPAWRAGYVTLKSGTKRWRGYVLGPNNTLLRRARKNVSDVLASWRTGKRVDIDARLIRVIARVSDAFGGRPVHVVSGFREHSHSRSSRHPLGRALDFSVEGVPNWAVRDYLRTLSQVGVGYYPNSTFVHVDVREESTYWIDHSGPGEAPRYANNPP